jgi:periplasmic divalent cation tolerance protein
MDEAVCEVVITAPDDGWLMRFVESLVEDRLCAGSHNMGEIRSIYRWDGRVQHGSESRVALHTRLDLVPEIAARAQREHPFEVPCVVAVPLVGGLPAYLRWIVDETRPPSDAAEVGGSS